MRALACSGTCATASPARRRAATPCQPPARLPRAEERGPGPLRQAALHLGAAAAVAAVVLAPLADAQAATYELGSKQLFDPMAYSGRWYEVSGHVSCVAVALQRMHATGGALPGSPYKPTMAEHVCGQQLQVASLKRGFAGEGQQDCHCTQVGSCRTQVCWPSLA